MLFLARGNGPTRATSVCWIAVKATSQPFEISDMTLADMSSTMSRVNIGNPALTGTVSIHDMQRI